VHLAVEPLTSAISTMSAHRTEPSIWGWSFSKARRPAERLRKGPFPLPEVLKIAIALAEALTFAHRQGIVHRDLKPGNIRLTRAAAQLMDFGLAKARASQIQDREGCHLSLCANARIL
jgi:serine/threonine protein kinase